MLNAFLISFEWNEDLFGITSLSQKLVTLLDVNPSNPLPDGSVVRYNAALDVWETVLLSDNPRTLDGGFY